MQLKFLSVIAAAVLLAACSSDTSVSDDSRANVSDRGDRPIASGPGPSQPSQVWLVENLGDRVFFDYDRYDLQPQGRVVIESWAGWMNQHPQVTAVIEGHADERGTREYNLALGNSRANTTLEYLTALGVAPSRLSIVSYGKERPSVLGSTGSAYAQNRRGVLVIN